MSLSRKFIIVIVSSILVFALSSIAALFFFYNTFLKIYLAEKVKTKEDITIDYINQIIEKQTLDDIDNIFSDVEIEFFELLEKNKWKIPLKEEKNRDVIINYLVKSGVTPKYIEEILPTNNLQKVLESMQQPWSPESNFISRLTSALILFDGVVILLIVWAIFIFARKTLLPIRQVTQEIKQIDPRSPNKTIVYDKQDEVWLLINAINQLSDRINIQENIRSRLLADISHELKTPITSIQCYLEWISDGVIKLDGKTLKSITEEMTRLISLVNQIMDYEKFENRTLELNVSKENVAHILKELSETHKNKLKENHQRIKVTWEEKQEIFMDKNLFKQVAHNLIGNFLKYAGRESVLTINITKNYIDFSDNGKGVLAKEIPFLTEKFYQANNEKTGDIKERGIGVWLAIVGKIIEAHNWKLQIRSDEGKWFSFKIIL